LVLSNDSKIKSDDILQKRKRMATPYTTPMSFGVLEKMAELGNKNGRFGATGE
jgi:hypothetical protein